MTCSAEIQLIHSDFEKGSGPEYSYTEALSTNTGSFLSQNKVKE